MRVDLFDFVLPSELIAQRPALPRDSARLLEVADGPLADRHVSDLPDMLQPNDLLVVNDTRVLPARLHGRRLSSGARGEIDIELLLLRRRQDASWSAMARPGKRLKAGDRLQFGDDLAATVVERMADGTIIVSFVAADDALARGLAAIGAMPLPPYIRHGIADQQDRSDYQTIFARSDGAVAAPTAGLHFTPSLLERLRRRGVLTATVTLHVGSGTFQPVRVADTTDHRMAAEWGSVDAAAVGAIEHCRRSGGRIISVGTTALRLLESVAVANSGRVTAWSGDTSLFIVPGFRFQVADLLLTNFHLPRSTLFMLVSAFAGRARMQKAYAHAIAARYRFYSYGDACLLHRAEAA